MHQAKVLIYELALLSTYPSSTASVPSSIEYKRIEYLHLCLESAKLSLDNFFAIDLSRYIGITFGVLLHPVRSLQALYWLALYEHPSWDREMVKSTTDVLDYITRVADRLEHAQRRLNQDRGAMALAAEMLRRTVEMWRAVLSDRSNAVQGGLDGSDAGPVDAVHGHFPLSFSMDDFMFLDAFNSFGGSIN